MKLKLATAVKINASMENSVLIFLQIFKLAALAFGFIIAGIVFGDDRLIGYSLMGIGVILAIIDIVKKSKQS